MIYALDARTANRHFPGIGRYVIELARGLADHLEGDERLLLLSDSSVAAHWNGELPAHERIMTVRAPASPFSLRQQTTIPRLLRRHGARLYHSPYYLMPYWTRMPTVVTIHDLLPERYPDKVSLSARVASRFATARALRCATHVLTVSEATRRDLMTLHSIEPERVTSVPLAAASHFRPQPEAERERVRRKHGLARPYLLYLGTDKPHKNLEVLLAAWRGLLAERSDLPTLALAGGWARRRARSESSTNLRYLGEVEEADLPGLLSGATLFVFPSLYEGFGLPVLEAMASGTPVVCSRTPALVELAGGAAKLFDPASPRDLARAIGELLSEEASRREWRKRGLERAARFSWSRTASATLAVYRRIAT